MVGYVFCCVHVPSGEVLRLSKEKWDFSNNVSLVQLTDKWETNEMEEQVNNEVLVSFLGEFDEIVDNQEDEDINISFTGWASYGDDVALFLEYEGQRCTAKMGSVLADTEYQVVDFAIKDFLGEVTLLNCRTQNKIIIKYHSA